MRRTHTVSPSRHPCLEPARPSESHEDPAPRGAYGTTITGLNGAHHLMRPVHPGWPTLNVHVVHLDVVQPVAREQLTDRAATYRLATNGFVRVDRATGDCTLGFPPGTSSPGAAELLHPYLCLPLATIRHWSGSDVFHAGGFVVDGAAWLVPGMKGAGKSTLLATLATLGVPVLADDLAVVHDGDVFAGPACIDLRDDAARALGVGVDLGVVGSRRRWRVELPPTPIRVPLAGWLELDWDDDVGLRPLPVDKRVQMLLANVALRPAPPRPTELLALASLPGYTLVRPPDVGQLRSVARRLLDLLERRRVEDQRDSRTWMSTAPGTAAG
jgi:hypothetical protein